MKIVYWKLLKRAKCMRMLAGYRARYFQPEAVTPVGEVLVLCSKMQ